jgi:hypothetical protein
VPALPKLYLRGSGHSLLCSHVLLQRWGKNGVTSIGTGHSSSNSYQYPLSVSWPLRSKPSKRVTHPTPWRHRIKNVTKPF